VPGAICRKGTGKTDEVLKHTPDITFHFDPSIEYAIHIAEVIQQLHGKGERTRMEIDGLLIVDKPDGLPSLEAVKEVKRRFGVKRQGISGPSTLLQQG